MCAILTQICVFLHPVPAIVTLSENRVTPDAWEFFISDIRQIESLLVMLADIPHPWHKQLAPTECDTRLWISMEILLLQPTLYEKLLKTSAQKIDIIFLSLTKII